MSWVLKLQGWCRRHYLPTFHGCVWDRLCREYGAPPVIRVMWSGHSWWAQIPGYWPTMRHDDDGWEVVSRWHRQLKFGHDFNPRLRGRT